MQIIDKKEEAICRIETAIIPAVIKSLMEKHTDSENWNVFADAIALLEKDINNVIKTESNIRWLNKLRDKIINYMWVNNFNTRKGFMAISYIASALEEAEAVIITMRKSLVFVK